MQNKKNEYMKSLGKRGGDSTKKKYGTEHYKKIGKQGQSALLKRIESNNTTKASLNEQ